MMTDAEAPNGAPALAVDDLRACYGKIQVLWGATFSVRPGELMAIVGANGAGKTTTLRVISGLLSAWGGGVRTFGRDMSGISAARVVFPHLRERERQLVGTLSGGGRQMVAIGRALMRPPRLLLVDEPSLGLAPALVQTVFRALAQVRDEGVTVVLVEQNVQQSLRLADHALVLESGKVRKRATGQELLADPEVRAAYLSH